MPGTPKQTPIETLVKLLQAHWPDYTVIGNKPYSKGTKLYHKQTGKLVQTFPSNDAAFLTMTESVTKNNGWYPGKDVSTPLFGDLAIDPKLQNDAIRRAEAAFRNDARRALDTRKEADELFSFVGVNPMDPNWKKKLSKIITIRKPHGRKTNGLLGTKKGSC